MKEEENVAKFQAKIIFNILVATIRDKFGKSTMANAGFFIDENSKSTAWGDGGKSWAGYLSVNNSSACAIGVGYGYQNGNWVVVCNTPFENLRVAIHHDSDVKEVVKEVTRAIDDWFLMFDWK